jgi:hypothetical protein
MILVAGIALVRPYWTFARIYPAIWIVGGASVATFGGIPVSIERIVVTVGAAGFLLAVATRRASTRPVDTLLLVGLMLWLGMYVASHMAHLAPGGGVRVVGLAQKAVLMVLTYFALQDERMQRDALLLFLASSAVASFVSVYAAATEGLTFVRASGFVVGDEGTVSFYRGIARAGAGNVLAVWIAVGGALASTRRSRKMGFWCLAIWLVFCSLLPLRREVLVMLPVGLSLVLWRARGGRRLRMAVATAVMASFVWYIVAGSEEWQVRLTKETSAAGLQREGRWLLIQYTGRILMEEPLLGEGPGNYYEPQSRYKELFSRDVRSRGGLGSHNSLSSAIVEAGIFAGVGLAMVIGALGRRVLRRRFGNTDIRWFAKDALFVQVVSMLMFGDGANAASVWMWFGLLYAIGLSSASSESGARVQMVTSLGRQSLASAGQSPASH